MDFSVNFQTLFLFLPNLQKSIDSHGWHLFSGLVLQVPFGVDAAQEEPPVLHDVTSYYILVCPMEKQCNAKASQGKSDQRFFSKPE